MQHDWITGQGRADVLGETTASVSLCLPQIPRQTTVVYLICTPYYPLGFSFLVSCSYSEGYHVYFNCRYVYHNSTSGRAEMSLTTVCSKKQARTAPGLRPWGLWTGGHSELISNLFPPMSNMQFSKQWSLSSVIDQSRRTPNRVELWFSESSFFVVPVYLLILNKLM